MPFLRSVALFFFAAFSIAKAATCSDFQIFANGITINAPAGNSPVDYPITIGEDLEFTVSPVGDDIKWTINSPWVIGVISDGPSCTPPISLEVTGNIVQPVELKVKTCGVEKTINIKLKVKPYIVTFDPNGGTPTPPPDSVEPGKFATQPTDPLKTGYSLSGWKMPNGTDYNFTTPVTDNITLKAAWSPNTYTVTFDPTGGTVSPTTKDVTFDAPVGNMPTPTKVGYDFSGWYSAISGGTEYKSTTPYGIAGPTTLYAKWVPKEYTLTFDVDSPEGEVNPTSKRVKFNEPVGDLPTPTRIAHKFIGWYSLPIGGTEYTSATLYQNDGPTTIYARWEFIRGTRPVIELLDFTIPTGLVYNGAEIASLPAAAQKVGTYGKLGDITILYDGKETPLPKDAGTYTIHAFIAQVDTNLNKDYYDTATVLLGTLTIDKRPATASIISVAAKDKKYDATTIAEIDEDDIDFIITPLYAGDVVTPDDYSYSAEFASPNVGTGITVSGTISWLASGPLSKNYIISPSPLPFATTADIKQATGELRIIDPMSPYEYTRTAEYAEPEVSKSPFIPDDVIVFEYKREDENDDAYTTYKPNRVGYWFVRATIPATANYTGDMDSKLFWVTRGNARLVKNEIEVPENSQDHFKEDYDLSGDLRKYYVGNVCDSEREDSIKIIIIGEPDIVLKLGNSSPHMQGDENQGYYYKIPFNFGKAGVSKPGLDTLIYTLISTDNIYKEYDTLYIETPIAFDSIVGQKWNNVLFINNNPRNNGGYEFTDFEWLKNDRAVGELQFYSAGSKSTDVLKPSDSYKVTMHTESGIRISTCEGNPKNVIPSVTTGTPAVTKQVLGINGKTAKPEQKVYNAYGAERKNTPVGVYIIKDR